jgi:hypothetical protein
MDKINCVREVFYYVYDFPRTIGRNAMEGDTGHWERRMADGFICDSRRRSRSSTKVQKAGLVIIKSQK